MTLLRIQPVFSILCFHPINNVHYFQVKTTPLLVVLFHNGEEMESKQRAMLELREQAQSYLEVQREVLDSHVHQEHFSKIHPPQ